MAAPLARNVVKDLAAEHGACLRPVQLRRTEIDTGYVEQVLIPCGHTLASVCPPCAERARILRAAQCREGWHLDQEPVIDPHPATEQNSASEVTNMQKNRSLQRSTSLAPRSRSNKPLQNKSKNASKRQSQASNNLRHCLLRTFFHHNPSKSNNLDNNSNNNNSNNNNIKRLILQAQHRREQVIQQTQKVRPKTTTTTITAAATINRLNFTK